MAVDFKTTLYNLNEPGDSIEYFKWARNHLEVKEEAEVEMLLCLDSIPAGGLCYSDERYLVYQSCFGEFGGDLLFQDRGAKDSVYYLQSTCPLMIDKRDGGYYITVTLAHLEGSGKVQFIKSPEELVRVHLDSLWSDWQSRMYPDLSSFEIWKILGSQGKVLIDTTGVTFDLFFPYQEQDYLIFSDHSNTYIGRLLPDSLITVDTLLNRPTMGYRVSSEMNNGYYHYHFRRNSRLGDIYAKGDSIVIAYK